MPNNQTSYRPPIMGRKHMVSAGHYLAAAAGYRILEEGGNAVDAGVAAGIAINVTLPHATNFGGVAPIAIYDAASDEVVTISGLGRWPKAANIEYFNQHCDGEIPVGVLRTVMPAAPDAWMTALERYGSMTFEEVVTPALELAEGGFSYIVISCRRASRQRGRSSGRSRDVGIDARGLYAKRSGSEGRRGVGAGRFGSDFQKVDRG